MKKVKIFLLGNIKTVIAFVLGILLSGVTVYAATSLLSQSVYYNNTTSGATSTNLQGALDELYKRANTLLDLNDMWTPQYYAFGGPYYGWCFYNDTSCQSYPLFPTTSTTPPSGKNVYLAKYADQYGICIKRNGTEHCFIGRNWIAEAQHLQKVFSGANDSCNVGSSHVICNASDFYCAVYSNGTVGCRDWGTNAYCDVDVYGSVKCDE